METSRQLLRADRVFDGYDQVIDHGAVLVSDAGIEAVGTAAEIGTPVDVPVIDLGDSTLLPGLIDVHNHVTFSGDARVVQQVMAHDIDAMLAQGRTTAANLLAAGVTSVRDLGALGDTAFRLSAEISSGKTVGPDLIASTAQLTSIGGPNAALGGGCGDLAAALRRIDADVAQGARVVKIIATGSVTDTGSDPTQPVFDDDTVRGIVEHAHALGLRVAAHAHGTSGVIQAARCGVDTIEHASCLTRISTLDTGSAALATGSPQERLMSWPDPAALDLLAAAGPWIVPTLAAALLHNQAVHAAPETLAGFAHRTALGRELLRRGLRLVAGTDGGGPGCTNLSLVLEIERLRQIGMSPAQALSAATGRAAECLGLSDRGVLRASARADIIAVPGDALSYLDVLRSPHLVMVGGRIVHRVHEES